MAWPPEAAASFTTTKGENRLCPDRLSSSTDNTGPPVPLEDELELLEDEDVEPLLDEELLLDELEELDEELLELDEDELLEDDELLLELEELEVPPSIVPAEAVNVTRSSLAPSSRLTILKV
jgi:hypothetical protein